MMAHVAHVTGLEQDIRCNFTLDVEVELVRRGSNLLRIKEAHGSVRSLPGRHCAKAGRERRARHSRKSITQAEHALQVRLGDDIVRGRRETQRSGVADGIAYSLTVEHSGAATNQG